MSFYLIAPLIVFLIWYALYHFSDDASAIESMQSAESLYEDEEKQEVVRKSETFDNIFPSIVQH